MDTAAPLTAEMAKGSGLKLMQTKWPGNFSAGNAVTHRGRCAHVVATPPGVITSDEEVPILYDDEANCFKSVPTSELKHRTF